MRLTELALRRAGAADLEEFQRREGLYPSGQERRRDKIRAPVLGRRHEIAEVDRCEIAQRQAVDEQAGAPLEQGLREAVRPLRVLQQRKGRRP